MCGTLEQVLGKSLHSPGMGLCSEGKLVVKE